MKTLILQGHSRPIKEVRFSYCGQFVYSASSDRYIFQWNAETGEKVMSYYHMASVNAICLTHDGLYMISGDATGCVYLWENKTGKCLKKVDYNPDMCIRSIELSEDDNWLILCYGGRTKNSKSYCNTYKLIELLSGIEEDKSVTIPATEFTPKKSFECYGSKYLKAKFANLDKNILMCREDGYLELLNFSNGKLITQSKFHDDIIYDMDINYEKGIILTASKDGVCCVINFNTFELIHKFYPQNPTRNLNTCRLAVIANPEYDVNIVSKQGGTNKVTIDVDNLFGLSDVNLEQNLSKLKNGKIQKDFTYAIISGGQDNKLVTTTNQKEGGFEILIYDILTGLEMTNFLVHFGPVNAMSVSKNNILASGGEDATVRLHRLDKYLFHIDKNK